MAIIKSPVICEAAPKESPDIPAKPCKHATPINLTVAYVERETKFRVNVDSIYAVFKEQ